MTGLEILDIQCSATILRKASRRLTQFYDDALAPSGLRSTQFAILIELARRLESPPSLNELAAELVLDRSTLGHSLRPLERDGLLTLRESVRDRRQRYIILSPAGKAKFEEALPLWQNAQERFNALHGPEAEELQRTLLVIAHDKRLGMLPE